MTTTKTASKTVSATRTAAAVTKGRNIKDRAKQPTTTIRTHDASGRLIDKVIPALPLSELISQGYVTDRYMDIAKQLDKTGEEGVIQCRITREFLADYMRANGANRAPRWGHCVALRDRFDRNFRPAATAFGLTRNGCVFNAGHSSKALALLTQPQEFWADYEIIPSQRKNDDGSSETVYVLPPVGKDFVYPPQDRSSEREYIVNVTVNAPEDTVLICDDLMLPRTAGDQLDMFAPFAAWLESVGGATGWNASDVAQILRAVYLRTSPAVEIEDPQPDGPFHTYGTLSKGGRINKDEYPVFWTVFREYIDAAIAAIISKRGEILIRWENSELPRKELWVAMILLAAGGSPNAKYLRNLVSAVKDRTNTHIQELADALTKPSGKSAAKAYTRPNADSILTYILCAAFETDYPEFKDCPTPWHHTDYRCYGPDMDDNFPDGKTRSEKLIEGAKIVAAFFQDPESDLIESVERKAKQADKAKTKTIKKPTKRAE